VTKILVITAVEKFLLSELVMLQVILSSAMNTIVKHLDVCLNFIIQKRYSFSIPTSNSNLPKSVYSIFNRFQQRLDPTRLHRPARLNGIQRHSCSPLKPATNASKTFNSPRFVAVTDTKRNAKG
jgi:hypothetical protein